MKVVAGLLVATGCLGYEEGRAAEGEAACRLRERCSLLAEIGYDDAADCIATATSQQWPACDLYRSERMQECLSGWDAALEAVDCDLLRQPPHVCAQVCGAMP
ncbi:MAG: hypothetical protein EXR71_07105 [Myxococcales bacterium]|nr:hypothetical protein [Myxococcales bacterium]